MMRDLLTRFFETLGIVFGMLGMVLLATASFLFLIGSVLLIFGASVDDRDWTWIATTVFIGASCICIALIFSGLQSFVFRDGER